MNKFIAIDLELEQPNTNEQTPDSYTDEPKIIQAGICVFKLGNPELDILHSETMMINYEFPLSNFIKTLTSIQDSDVNNSELAPIDIVRRLAQLRTDFDTSRQIIEWGGGDVKTVLEESGISNDNFHSVYGFARATINAKHLYQCYAMANNLKNRGGLSKSMGQLELQFKGTHYNGKNRGTHWAEADAINTARIFNKLITLMRKE